MEKQPKYTLEKFIASEVSYWQSQSGKNSNLSTEQKFSHALRSIRRVCEQNGVPFDEAKTRDLLEKKLKLN
jgi:hypothetical protein